MSSFVAWVRVLVDCGGPKGGTDRGKESLECPDQVSLRWKQAARQCHPLRPLMCLLAVSQEG